jgi:hypothetical protein
MGLFFQSVVPSAQQAPPDSPEIQERQVLPVVLLERRAPQVQLDLTVRQVQPETKEPLD